MPVQNLLENVQAEPLPEFHHAFLVTGRAEMTAFTREGKQIFMTTVLTSDAGKAVAQIAAIQITVDHFLNIGPPEAVIP